MRTPCLFFPWSRRMVGFLPKGIKTGTVLGAGGPELIKPHTASTSDTWLFNNRSYPIFEKTSNVTAVSHLCSSLCCCAHWRRISNVLAQVWLLTCDDLPAMLNKQHAGGSAKLSAAFVGKFRQVYGALVNHLQQKGWLQHVRAIFLDEPV